MMRYLLFQVFLLLSAVSFAQSNPFVLGTIEEIYSKELNEKRILNIYLPEGYQQTDSLQYPVIYLLDGSADEDFIHISGLVQFNSFEWVNRVPKSIVVGIATVDRRRDYTAGSAKFIAFIEKELQPFIQKRYKTTSSKTIIGQSLGGLLATEILLTKPSLFNRYIIVSPSLWWNNAALLETPVTNWPASNRDSLRVYIAVGKEGLTPGTNPRVMEVDANLLYEKIKMLSPQINVWFDYLPAENHATILHQAVNNAFIRMN